MSDLKANEVVDTHYEEPEEPEDNDDENREYGNQVVKFAFDGKDGENRKRKRETNGQLKVFFLFFSTRKL